MEVNLKGSELWKYAISTGNFYLIPICSIFLQILPKRWHSKAKRLLFPIVEELFTYNKY